MNNKKTQMEIMGLAIVVILIIIGMLFVVRFVMVRKPAEFKAEFTQAQLASNMLNAFLKSNTGCSDMSITELLQDCGQSQSVYCSGRLSCEYVKDTAKSIFIETLEKWNYEYRFSAYFDESSPIIVVENIDVGEICTGEKKSKIFPVPTTTRSLYTKLDICS